jgi:hypothetical protein
MIEVRERTRRGCSMASVCAIMPPSEAPTRCAALNPSLSRRSTVSAAMSESVYGAAHRPSGHRRHDVERAPAVDLARQTDVAVVEPDHAVAARRQHGAELVVPENHLRAQPHDEDERARVAGADDLVLELDAVGARAGHDQRPGIRDQG